MRYAQNDTLPRPAAAPPERPHSPTALIIAVLLALVSVGGTWLLMR